MTNEPRKTIVTYTVLEVNPLEMSPSDVDILDIAHALSRTCRYGGHSVGHLSVARHSLWVASHIGLDTPELQLYGLLHDASEAYLGDMVSPVKYQLIMRHFREAEQTLEACIAERFGLPYPQPDVVKLADFVVTTLEVEHHRHTWDRSALVDKEEFLSRYYRLEAAR